MFKHLVGIFLLLSVALFNGPCLAETGYTTLESDSSSSLTAAVQNPYLAVPTAVKNMYHPTRFPDIHVLTQPHCLFTSRSEYAKILAGQKPGTVASHGSLWN